MIECKLVCFRDIFSLGFGPFRWVCTSADPADLRKTDEIATNVLRSIVAGENENKGGGLIKMANAFSLSGGIPKEIAQQYEDNLRWLKEAERHQMVVGSQARILYSDQQGRVAIALAFNKAVAAGEIKVGFTFCNSALFICLPLQMHLLLWTSSMFSPFSLYF